MTSNISLVIFGLLLVTMNIVVRSAPAKILFSPKKASLKSTNSVKPSITSIITSPIASEINDEKQNLDSDYYDEEKISLKIKETSAQIPDNIAKSVNTDNSKVLTDMKMNPNELINLARLHRNIHFNDRSNQRRKRSLLKYDFHNADPFYESLFEQEQFVRPPRTFAPIYWHPSSYTRYIRSALASSLYEPSEWNRIDANTIENDDIDDDQIPFIPYDIDDDDDDDESEYEYDRYPILLDSSSIPYDNLQLQQEYNIDDLPIDEDNDQDEEFFSTDYGPIESYFK